MRLTPEVLAKADGFLNVYQDRELNLRGLKIPVIENLAVLQDQFDVIDFSDNEIKKLDNFPVMKRLTCLLLNNNTVTKIGTLATWTEKTLPNLSELILTNNRISSLSEVSVLASSCGSSLKILSLMDNAVVLSAHYRMYTIHKIPSLTILDFKKITRKEREEANNFFATAHGQNMLQNIENEREQRAAGTYSSITKPTQMILTDEQKMQVKEAIEKATTKDQVDYIEKQLKSGNFEFLLSKVETKETSSLEQTLSPPVDPVVVSEDETKASSSSDMEVVEEVAVAVPASVATEKVQKEAVQVVETNSTNVTEVVGKKRGRRSTKNLQAAEDENKADSKEIENQVKHEEKKEEAKDKDEEEANGSDEEEEEKVKTKAAKKAPEKKKTKAQLAKEAKQAAAEAKKEAKEAVAQSKNEAKEAAAAEKKTKAAAKKKGK